MAARTYEPIPTRRSLLNRLKNWDDQEGWKEFFDTYWRLIYSVAAKSGLSDAEAQDIVQETILDVAKRMPGFQYDPALGSFKAWLLLITRRRIADFFRKREREPKRAELRRTTTSGTAALDRIPDPAGKQFEAAWEEEWQKHILKAAITKVKRQVDPKQFQMFDATALKGWPVAEVVRNLKVTPGQLYTAKHRVAALIKDEVQRLEAVML